MSDFHERESMSSYVKKQQVIADWSISNWSKSRVFTLRNSIAPRRIMCRTPSRKTTDAWWCGVACYAHGYYQFDERSLLELQLFQSSHLSTLTEAVRVLRTGGSSLTVSKDL